ncbi:MAG: hypothetical protein M0Z72_02715 [Deltaproteobacteria bacterium]|nr:hypothetical protein [Deltaproteobacteria bacterium]
MKRKRTSLKFLVLRFLLFLIIFVLPALALSGCGSGAVGGSSNYLISGVVQGAPAPVTSGTVLLYSVNSSNSSDFLGSSAIGANGSFSISYSGTGNGVGGPYILVVNNVNGTGNSLMDIIPNLSPVNIPNVTVNELTTVDVVEILDKLAGSLNIQGSPTISFVHTLSTNKDFMSNFKTIYGLVQSTIQQSTSSPLQTELFYIASALASCINPSAYNGECTALENNISSYTGINPSSLSSNFNTLAVVLMNAYSSDPALETDLSKINDTFVKTNNNQTWGGSGSTILPMTGSTSTCPGPPSLTYTTIAGGTTGFSDPNGIAVDQSGNVWVTNDTGNSITEIPAYSINATGATAYSMSIAAINISGGNAYFYNPDSIAIDSAGDVWVVNFGGQGSVTEIPAYSISGGGSEMDNSAIVLNDSSDASNYLYPYTPFPSPTAVAADTFGNVWIVNTLNLTYIPSYAIHSAAIASSSLLKSSGSSAISTVDSANYAINSGLTSSAFVASTTGCNNVTPSQPALYMECNSQVVAVGGAPVGITSDSLGDIWTTGGTVSVSVYPFISEIPADIDVTGEGWNLYAYCTTFMNNVTEESSNGSSYLMSNSGNPIGTCIDQFIETASSASLNFPMSIAFNSFWDNIWIANGGSLNTDSPFISELPISNIGNITDIPNIPGLTATAPTGSTTGLTAAGLKIITDNTGNIWVTAYEADLIYIPSAALAPPISTSNIQSCAYPLSKSNVPNPVAMAAAPNGNIWVANGTDNSVTEIKNNTTTSTNPPHGGKCINKWMCIK